MVKGGAGWSGVGGVGWGGVGRCGVGVLLGGEGVGWVGWGGVLWGAVGWRGDGLGVVGLVDAYQRAGCVELATTSKASTLERLR